MDLGSGRRKGGVRSSVVAGSVWESRMKSDQVKGGIKVFPNGEENQSTQDENAGTGKTLNSKKGQTIGGVAGSGKRKTWKSDGSEGVEKNPIQVAKGKNEPSQPPPPKSPIPVTKELSVSVDGVKKSPVQVKKGRSEGSKELSKSVDGIEKSPNKIRKLRSEISKGSAELSKEIVESGVKGSAELSKEIVESGVKGSAELAKEIVESGEVVECDSVENKEKSDLIKVADESSNDHGSNSVLGDQKNENDGSVEATEKNGSEENCKEFGVCEEKVISSSVRNADADEDGDEQFNEEEEEEEEEVEVEEEVEEEEIEVEVEKKQIVIKEMNVPEQKPKPIVNEVKKFNQFNNRSTPFSSTVNVQPPPVVKRATPIYANPPSKPSHSSHDHQNFPQSHNKLQNLVDLVMWRDVSKSAFVFGIGTFIIISSSYTKDLNISFISVISYLGLVYLATIFLYRSIICRGVVEIDETNCVLGEEEAVWILKLFLPYLNEFLLKLRALFSGDPATTMKLAVLLFVLARCGSSITIWKMAKLGFFGVFTVPKVCSSYSHQLTAFGKFWIRRFRDAWTSCTHKKAVAMGIFTLVWNLSSTIARIWAAFVLFVALRYYQQRMLEERGEEDADPGEETQETLQRRNRHPRGPRQGLKPTVLEANLPNKLKKGF
ncbi:hypothetical protein SLA2020_176420 [Shorea laevis]